jgi:hypothetical protein
LTNNKAYVACRQGSGGDALARKLQKSVMNRLGPFPA